MRTIAMLGAIAAFAAAPLAAQGKAFRTGDVIAEAGRRIPSTVMGDVARDEQEGQARGRKSGKVPPGHLPPAGMCRIWIDDVPPGQQPAPTDCPTAVATKPANARVIWGDESAFPGKGNGKFGKQGLDKGKKNKAHRGDDDSLDDRNANRARAKAVAKRAKKG